MVAGEPLRRVGAPTPRLLRSPPLAKVQSHSHHLLRQVLFAYLAVPPCLVELVVIAILHHSLLHCVVHNPCHPISRASASENSSSESYPEAGADGRGDLAGGEVGEGERGGARSVLPLVPEGPAPNALSLFLSTTLGEGGGGPPPLGAGLRCSCFRLPDFGGLRPKFFMVNLSGLPPFPTLVHPSDDSLGRGCCACWCCECACDAAAGAAAAAGGATGGAAKVAVG